MRSQKHNQGKLAELKVLIEQDIVESIKNMSQKTGMTVEELVVIALKRFKSSHVDYESKSPKLD